MNRLFYNYPARVLKVANARTFDIEIDFGLRRFERVRVQLVKTDWHSPDKSPGYFHRAKACLSELLLARSAVPSTVTVPGPNPTLLGIPDEDIAQDLAEDMETETEPEVRTIPSSEVESLSEPVRNYVRDLERKVYGRRGRQIAIATTDPTAYNKYYVTAYLRCGQHSILRPDSLTFVRGKVRFMPIVLAMQYLSQHDFNVELAQKLVAEFDVLDGVMA